MHMGEPRSAFVVAENVPLFGKDVASHGRWVSFHMKQMHAGEPTCVLWGVGDRRPVCVCV